MAIISLRCGDGDHEACPELLSGGAVCDCDCHPRPDEEGGWREQLDEAVDRLVTNLQTAIDEWRAARGAEAGLAYETAGLVFDVLVDGGTADDAHLGLDPLDAVRLAASLRLVGLPPMPSEDEPYHPETVTILVTRKEAR